MLSFEVLPFRVGFGFGFLFGYFSLVVVVFVRGGFVHFCINDYGLFGFFWVYVVFWVFVFCV